MTTSEDKAMKIMGDHCVSVSNAMAVFDGVWRSRCKDLTEIPFSVKKLEEKKETHILVPKIFSSIKHMAHVFHGQLPAGNYSFFAEKKWPLFFDLQARSLVSKLDSGWMLLGKGILPDSPYKSFKKQILLLKNGEQVPSVAELAYCMALMYLVKGETIFLENWAFTGSSVRGLDGEACWSAFLGPPISLVVFDKNDEQFEL